MINKSYNEIVVVPHSQKPSINKSTGFITWIISTVYAEEIRIPFQHLLHVFFWIPPNCHITQLLLALSGTELFVLDELVLPGKDGNARAGKDWDSQSNDFVWTLGWNKLAGRVRLVEATLGILSCKFSVITIFPFIMEPLGDIASTILLHFT